MGPKYFYHSRLSYLHFNFMFNKVYVLIHYGVKPKDSGGERART